MKLYKNSLSIGNISNNCGGLLISKMDNKFYWGIENGEYSETLWEEIPESLFNQLEKFEPEEMVYEKKEQMTEDHMHVIRNN